jgi:anti-anti-sigma factor
MEIKIEQQERLTSLYLKGRFDAHTTQIFFQAISDIAATTDKLLIDLSQVNFIDSRGLAALISAQHRYGSHLSLRGVQDAVRLIFEITRLDSIFRFENSA